MRFLPKEENFFELFNQAADIVVRAAEAFLDMVQRYEDTQFKAAEIRRLEHEADAVVHQIARRLNSSFVTPIDREDIHNLALGLDDVLDYIEATSDRLFLYRITQPTQLLIDMAQVLVNSTLELRLAIQALPSVRDPEKILSHCVRLNALENEADGILSKALSCLFDGHTEPLEVMKWKEIYEHLETATDKCEDVANVLETVVVKNA
ncbi:MAG TPA: DUF47 family protein [Armatimonadota bacterium]|jgi:hypothetical protein